MNEIIPNADEIKNLEAQISGIDITKLDPNDNGKVKQETVVQPETQVEQPTVVTTEVSVDPIETELERVKGQTQGKSPKEKFEYKLQRELAQAKAMGIDIAGLAGIKAEQEETDEDKPLTRKDLKEYLSTSKTSTKSATEMALEIANEAERELHIYYLENKVNPNLTEEEKFQTAKDMVNAIKLKNQVSLNSLKPQTQSHSTSSSFQPEKTENFDNQRLTPEESYILNDAQKRGVPMTKEDVIKMRK